MVKPKVSFLCFVGGGKTKKVSTNKYSLSKINGRSAVVSHDGCPHKMVRFIKKGEEEKYE